ncbi:MAG: hypothetical protein M1414_04040 [Candidatus Thermoplasmatota archaeon]|jgi:tmRNA-binding protein|nr:hypothetical protein [Candidatus Thermoplasmatota archaeon]
MKKVLTGFDTMKMLTLPKKEITWLYEIVSQNFHHSLVKLDMAFKSFFKKIQIIQHSGKRRITSTSSYLQDY